MSKSWIIFKLYNLSQGRFWTRIRKTILEKQTEGLSESVAEAKAHTKAHIFQFI